MEGKTQAQLIKFLKSKGCFVLKTRPGPGVPTGCPDVIFMLEGFWGAIEVKADSKSPYRPLQKETLAKFDRWSYGRTIHSENYNEVIAELERIL
jgi:Holliday junction resolvase